jgi:hypothetical protein
MNLLPRKVSAIAIVAMFSVWPIVHTGIVKRYDLHPWRFFGLAMYAVPPPQLQAREIMVSRFGEKYREVSVASAPAPYGQRLLGAIMSVVSGRSTWGVLYHPDTEAEILFKLMPSADSLVLSLDSCRLDATAIVQCHAIQYICEKRDTSHQRLAECCAAVEPVSTESEAQPCVARLSMPTAAGPRPRWPR